MTPNMYKVFRVISLIVILSTAVVSCQSNESRSTSRELQEKTAATSDSKHNGRAISLKMLQKKLEICVPEASCPEDALQLYNINVVMGYVLDDINGDIVLIGKIDDSMPPLYLDNFVVALRNSMMKYAELRGRTYYYSSPACSIDPDSKILKILQNIGNQIQDSSSRDKVQRNLKEWQSICQMPQQVRVLGIPHDTRFGQIMVEADYYMKRLANGSVTLDVDGFTSLTDMALNIARRGIEENKPASVPLSSLNRFWFYPGESSYLEDKGIIIIKKCMVKLLTEEEYLTERGEITGSGRKGDLADMFARNFTHQYAAVAKQKPIYAELESLFRFVALAKIMKHKNAISGAGVDLDYLIHHFPVERIQVSRTLPGVSHVKEFKQKRDIQNGYSIFQLWLPSCGGVCIDINAKDNDISEDRTGSLFEIRKEVLKTRLSPDTLSWDYSAKWPSLQ